MGPRDEPAFDPIVPRLADVLAHQLFHRSYRQDVVGHAVHGRSFASRSTPYLVGIFASARYRLNTSALEGMNDRIKVIKRTAYGYRDSEYFFLKIHDAIPGKVR